MIMQQKFIYAEMYLNPNASSCGCYLYGTESTAARLGMTSNSLEDAIAEFERRRLIEYDKATGEIYVIDWPRWHLYKTPAAKGALKAAIEKIQSQKLRAFVKKAYESTLDDWKGKDKEKDKASSTKAEEALPSNGPTKAVKQPVKSRAGILCWTNDDRNLAEELEKRYGVDAIRRAIAIQPPGVAPLPSRVEEQLRVVERIEAAKVQRRETERQLLTSQKVDGMRDRPESEMVLYRERY